MKKQQLTLALLAILTITFHTNPSHQASNDIHNPFPLLTNPRLLRAFTALQAWKHAITSDPKGFTADWWGLDVCNYTGIYCTKALDDPLFITVAGIDLNHGNIVGFLPEELGLLTDLTLFHINSNRFYGTVPPTFHHLKLLFELDISNNKFSGPFPSPVLSLPALKYLDIRFNNFSGNVPSALFNLKLDALFINNNNFNLSWPDNLANSPVSVIVFANNEISGCFPSSIGKMKDTLNEMIIKDSGLKGCLPSEIGLLSKLTVFDVSNNSLAGSLPESMAGMKSLEQLNVANNKLSGKIPESICSLPKLENFTYSDNYFCAEPPVCLKLPEQDDQRNCIPYRPLQRSEQECAAFYAHPVDCGAYGCKQS